MSSRTSYDQDFVRWAEETAGLLEQRRFEEVDWDHVVEEWWSLPKSDRRELYSRLQVLIAHLLKWRYQSERRSTSWQSTILVQRKDLRQLLLESPSLRARAEKVYAEVYADAREQALVETRLPSAAIPVAPVLSLNQVLDEGFLPE